VIYVGQLPTGRRGNAQPDRRGSDRKDVAQADPRHPGHDLSGQSSHGGERAQCGGCACTPALAEGGDSVAEVFTEGDLLYKAMLRSISAARHSVYMESYIFADDEIGWPFAKALAERVRAGVDVRVHLDAAGFLFRGSGRLRRYLRHSGVGLKFFHRWSWRRPLRYNRRSHRKLLVIDALHAYTGGFNIHRENSRCVYGQRRWRDTHVRVCGDLAAQAAELFRAFWLGKRRLPHHAPRTASVLVQNFSRNCRKRLRCLYADMFAGAQRTLYVSTPYFAPDRGVQRKLIAAAQRGVDVRLLLPCKSDVRLAGWAARAAYGTLLAGGVRVYEYLPRMLHTKTAVADDNYATIGTANLDRRSFFLNYELNVFTRNRELCRQLGEQFLEDLSQAREFDAESWGRRIWHSHLAETLGWLVRRWL